MTLDPKGPKAISNSPKRSSTMNKPEHPRRALGKGKGALLPTRTHTPPPAPGPHTPAEPREASLSVAIEAINPNPQQPRRNFQHELLAETAQSMRSSGMI